jgi:hypothetical protein
MKFDDEIRSKNPLEFADFFIADISKVNIPCFQFKAFCYKLKTVVLSKE